MYRVLNFAQLIGDNGFIDTEMYHNTELLLKLYRTVFFRVNQRHKQIDEDVVLAERQELTDYIASITDWDVRGNKLRIYERLLSMNTSLCLLEIMEGALGMLRAYPDGGDRGYHILRLAYFETVKLTNEKIMEQLDIPATSYYRYRKNAVQAYAVMLWGCLLPDAAAPHLLRQVGKALPG